MLHASHPLCLFGLEGQPVDRWQGPIETPRSRLMSQIARGRRPVGALLLGAVLGAGFAFLAYLRIAELPRAPGDWFWNGPIAFVEGASAAVGGPLVDGIGQALGIRDFDLARQRLLAPAACLLTLLLIVVLAARRKPQTLTPVCLLAALGLMPLMLGDPTSVASQTRLLVFPSIAALCLLPIPAALIGGLCGSTLYLVAQHSIVPNPLFDAQLGYPGRQVFALGCAIFCSGCAAQRVRGWRRSVLAGLSFLVVAVAIDILATRNEEALWSATASTQWWVDADASCTARIGPWIIEEGLALGIAAAFVGATLLVYSRNLGMLLAFATAGIAIFLAGTSVTPMRQRATTLERDTELLASYSITTTFQNVPHLLLNLPAHVRPLLHSNAHATAKPIEHLELFTPDFGDSIHIPTHWDFKESRLVLRWTNNGVAKTSWRRILDLEPLPTRGVLRDASHDLADFAATPSDWLRIGTLEKMLASHVDFDAWDTVEEPVYSQNEDWFSGGVFRANAKSDSRVLLLVGASSRRSSELRERSFVSVRHTLGWNRFRLVARRQANGSSRSSPESSSKRAIGGCYWIVDIPAGPVEFAAERPKFY